MISPVVSRASAGVLAAGGVLLLFAPDEVMPALLPGASSAAQSLGQCLAAAWLAMAVLNWLQRNVVLGGIYGRPIVLANLTLYFVTAASLARPLLAGGMPQSLWVVFAPAAALALVYAALLFRGPFDALEARATG